MKFYGFICLHSFQFIVLVAGAAQNNMCGLPAPDPDKTCISVRLPWNPAPIHFCTDKKSFSYRSQCQFGSGSHCGMTEIRNDSLMVADPWSCCPHVSHPDSCVFQECPPAPLNRKCETKAPDTTKPFECCDNYFCEANATRETCHFKLLEPSCTTPPKGKTNCVAFVDPYGCCPKFQCDGEGKSGQCPAEVEAMKFMDRFNSTETASATASPDSPVKATKEKKFAKYQSQYGGEIRISAYFRSRDQKAIACIGDFNCPGNMKCCSHDMNVYVTDGQYMSKNKSPTMGHCMEPATKAKT